MESTARFAEVEAILRGAAPLRRFNLHETRLQGRAINVEKARECAASSTRGLVSVSQKPSTRTPIEAPVSAGQFWRLVLDRQQSVARRDAGETVWWPRA
jgi:hypothetical protein